MPQLSPDQLDNMRQLIGQNPEMTQALVQQIAAQHPGLLQQLGANPEAIITEILQGGDSVDDDDGEGLPPNTAVLNVTQEERDAIERVSFMRLPRRIFNLIFP